jgi:glycosyltransferase involved in cell wall biosynthesis
MNPILSIIIPCFNAEATLESTLKSVLNQDFQDWEAIIVNDGSIDGTDEIALKWTNQDKRFKYFSKENEGLGKTRNYGISRSNGIYILPLDSDNLLEKDFALNAIKALEKDSNIGVVHGDAEYFGERKGLWKVDDFNLKKMFIHNYIDACAIYKKELWEKIGGYDENIPYQGHEDWEFWLSLGSHNVIFYNLRKVTFKYFVSKNSMIRSFSDDMLFLNQDYIVKKHSKSIHNEYVLAIVSAEKELLESQEKLRSKRYVLDLFFYTFFGFTFFKSLPKSFKK